MQKLKWYSPAVLVGVGFLAGCSSLPEVGPSADAVVSQANGTGDNGASTGAYALVNIDANVANTLSHRIPDSLYGSFGDHRASVEPRIGVGDMLTVTIWEASAGGLFSGPVLPGQFSSGAKSATIPPQSVGRDGRISVPYAGAIHVLGKTPLQVQTTIQNALQGKAIQPQALVSITNPVSSSVTVLGEVGHGAVIPLSAKGDRLMDVVALAGGVRGQVNEMVVRLSRGPRTVSVPLIKVVSNPNENISMRAGDTLTIVRDPQTFTVFGATGNNALVPFDSDSMNLSNALAKVGGLQDTRSDATGVFVFRYEPYAIAHALLPESPLVVRGKRTPVVYRLNLKNAASMFVAQTFPVFNHDVIYVSDAPLVETQKIMQIFSTLSQPLTTTSSVLTSASSAKSLGL
ncbi:MAG: polysaccharide biosynthesis/export family protein [Hyphomicrobiales bacterium]|nr:polysaccharide biosynthesis/export family protein [Hyphomicrobiales bacterium]MDE2114970.1 polysaccharide biosynthesis/export family protein [Hyphomicrobiales bacterium]